MKTLCRAISFGLAFTMTLQAQNRGHLGENTPKTAPDPTADYIGIYEEARRLYNAGRLDESLAQVEVVVAKYPHYAPAVQLRSLIETTLRNDPSRILRRRLDHIVIPRVKFRDALLEGAIDFLRDETRRLDREGKGVNLVVLLPDEIRTRKVTLDLIDARASDVLEYLAEAGGFKYRLERSAVLISAKEPATPGVVPPVAPLPSEVPPPATIPNANP